MHHPREPYRFYHGQHRSHHGTPQPYAAASRSHHGTPRSHHKTAPRSDETPRSRSKSPESTRSRSPTTASNGMVYNSLYLKVVAFSVISGSAVFGLSVFWVMFDLRLLQPRIPHTLIFIIGVMLGSSVASCFATYYGLRGPLRGLSLIMLPTYVLAGNVTARYWPMLVARMLGGFATGSYMLLALTYLAEVTLARSRGRVMVIMGFFYWVGAVLSGAAYRWMNKYLYFGFIPVLLFFFIMCWIFLPCSPYFVSRIREDSFAMEILSSLRCGSRARVQEEMEGIRELICFCAKDYWSHRFKTANWERVVIMAGLTYFPNYSGFSLNLQAHQLVAQTNQAWMTNDKVLNDVQSFTQMGKMPFIVSGLSILMGILGFLIMYHVIDKCGRRTLLLLSAVGCMLGLGISCAGLFLHYYMKNTQGFILMIGSAIFFLFYFMGYSFVPLIVLSEIFQQQNKLGFCAFWLSWHFASMACANFCTRFLVQFAGAPITAAFFVLINFFGVFFFVFVFVETRRLPLYEIQHLIDKVAIVVRLDQKN